jgi:hypothetical protein
MVVINRPLANWPEDQALWGHFDLTIQGQFSILKFTSIQQTQDSQEAS